MVLFSDRFGVTQIILRRLQLKKFFVLISSFVLVALVFSVIAFAGCKTTTAETTTAATTAAATTAAETTAAWVAPEGSALVSLPVTKDIVVDGVADDALWANAADLVIPVAGGFNNFKADAKFKSVYTADRVFFLVTYADPTQSFLRIPWQKQEDGSWIQLKDPNDTKGGDNTLTYEDKFSLIWNINNSIKDFEKTGCFLACHAGENSDLKAYGNLYTPSEGELGDNWHWKSVRNDGQIDDQYLDWTKFNLEKSPEAGRKSDAKESGGYVENFASMPDPNDAAKTVPDKTKPGFTSPNIDLTTGAPGYILDSEKVALDQAALDAMPVGSIIPGIVKSPFVGDRGDISAAWKWADGQWTVEFSRKLVTGSKTDVQFSDLAAKYFFGLAIFDNVQVRHAFESSPSFLVFQPK